MNNIVQSTFKEYQWPMYIDLVPGRFHMSPFKESHYYWNKAIVYFFQPHPPPLAQFIKCGSDPFMIYKAQGLRVLNHSF